MNCKFEFQEGYGGGVGKRDAALPLPTEHTMRCALTPRHMTEGSRCAASALQALQMHFTLGLQQNFH